MPPGGTNDGSLPDVDLTRRQALLGLAGGGIALGAARAVDNVLVGYGTVGGTNLIEQDLAALARQRFGPRASTYSVGGHNLGFRDGRIEVSDATGTSIEELDPRTTSPERAAALDAELDLEGGPIEELIVDLPALRAGEFTFEFHRSTSFFDRLVATETRPFTVGAVRGPRFDGIEPETVRAFARVDPTDPRALVQGIARGFREYAGYDTPQYVAGSIEDNLLLGAIDLRRFFRSPTSFDAIMSGDVSGLFCYDFTYRSIEAFHSVAPHRQTAPVVGAVVTDARHKHVYTGLASVVREGGEVIVPMTFVDYMHSTQYDDFRLRGVFGEGVEAYDRRHRTDGIYWNRYARW